MEGEVDKPTQNRPASVEEAQDTRTPASGSRRGDVSRSTPENF